MKTLRIALAVIAALTLGVMGSAEARDRGGPHGAQKHRSVPMQHRTRHRGFQRGIDRRQARQRARIREGAVSGRLNRHQVARLRTDQRRVRTLERHFRADGRFNRQERRILNHALDRSSKRIWRMKGKHYWRHGGYRPRFRVKHGFRKHGHYLGHSHHSRRHHRHVEHVYPVYDDTPAHSLGLDIETKDFRFSVNKSG